MQTESSAAPRPVADSLPVAPWTAAWGWALLSFLAFVLSVLTLLWPMSAIESTFGIHHAVALAMWAFAWTVAGGLLALVAARMVFGAWFGVRAGAWLILVGGAIVSAAHLGVLADWLIGRFGASDPDYVGVTFMLFAVVAGVAIAGFAVQFAPRRALWAPMIGVVAGALIAVVILLMNVGGLAGGLSADSWPLAGATIAATFYIGAVGVFSLARLRSA